MWVWSLGQEDPLEEEMATHSSILAWRSSWTDEPGGLQSMGSHRVGCNWATEHTHTTNRDSFTGWYVRIHGQRSLLGYSPWGCKESDTTEWLNTQAWEQGTVSTSDFSLSPLHCNYCCFHLVDKRKSRLSLLSWTEVNFLAYARRSKSLQVWEKIP